MKWNELAQLTQHPWLQRIEFHQSLPSTNDQAAVLAAEEQLACPALVLAEEQTAGRGRGGNRWWSAAGGLMFSLVLERTPAASSTHWFGYSLAAGLAICEALDAVCPSAPFAVKWPNDVYAGERKICGILSESPASAPGRLIVGIGVNVNNSFQSAPQELAQTATALCDLDGQSRSAIGVLGPILQRLEQRWSDLTATGFEPIRTAWLTRSLLTGRTVQLQAGQRTHVGVCLGIDEQGALVLQTESGRQSFAAGSIVHFE